MKVCLYNLTTTTQMGGVESFVWEIAARLPAYDVEVEVLGGNGYVNHELPSTVRVLKFPYLPRGLMRRIPFLARNKALLKLIERLSFGIMSFPTLLQGKYDIIHILKPYDLPFASFAKILTGAKLLLGCQGTDYFAGDRLFTRFVDGSVACSHFNARQILEHFHFLPIVVFNGFNADRFKPMPIDQELRARFAGPSDTLLLFSGRLIGWKGVNDLLDALALMDPTVKLVIAGDGEKRGELERQAGSLGIGDRVFFVGRVQQIELPKYYAISDLVVLTSLAHETFSIVSCEALGCERAVVGTNVGGIPELVEELVPPADPAALAERIRALIADPARRRQVAQRGRERVLSFLTWEATTARVYEAYASLMGGERVFDTSNSGRANATRAQMQSPSHKAT